MNVNILNGTRYIRSKRKFWFWLTLVVGLSLWWVYGRELSLGERCLPLMICPPPAQCADDTPGFDICAIPAWNSKDDSAICPAGTQLEGLRNGPYCVPTNWRAH